MRKYRTFLDWKIENGLFGWDHEYADLIDAAHDFGVTKNSEEITTLRQQLHQTKARVAEQQNTLNLFIKATQKAEANGYGQDHIHHDDSWIDDLGAVMDYAMRQQADELEKAGGEQ